LDFFPPFAPKLVSCSKTAGKREKRFEKTSIWNRSSLPAEGLPILLYSVLAERQTDSGKHPEHHEGGCGGDAPRAAPRPRRRQNARSGNEKDSVQRPSRRSAGALPREEVKVAPNAHGRQRDYLGSCGTRQILRLRP